MKYGDDTKLVMRCVDLIDDDIGEPAHDPFASALSLSAVAQARKFAQPFDCIQNALDNGVGSSRVVFGNPR